MQPKYWSFSFTISPSNDDSGLISPRIFWFDLLAVQGTLKSLFQHHSLKVSILQHSAFFMVQHLHWYVTTGKTVAWSIQTSVNKVITPLFNTLSRLSLLFFQYTYIHILRGLFLGLKFFYWSICLSLSHCLIYCCFVVVIEVR